MEKREKRAFKENKGAGLKREKKNGQTGLV